MDPETFFTNFEMLAEAPNGVQKLRELILQLAVMGKLVPQDPNEEPASVLLEKMEAEKKRLTKESKTKGSKSISAIGSDQAPYEIPSSWEWTALSECGLINPRNDIPDKKEVSFVPMTYISEKYGQAVETETRRWEEIKKGFTHFAENDVVLAKITPCFQNGKSAVMKGLKNGFGAGTTELHVFRPFTELMSPEYAQIYLKSPDFIYGGIPKMTGSAGQKRVPKDYFSENPFPLPPLAEQKRIVSKVDELMALCDKLEARRQKKQELQSKLNSAALDRMLSAESQEEFEQHWRRICENFDLLYDNPENVEKLRQAILQLAVQGKLVEQNPEDEPASVLIEKIEAEKKRYAKEYNLREKEPLPSVEADEEIFKLPAGWIWSRIGSSFLTSSGTTPKRSNHDYFIGGTENWVKTTDLTNGIVTSCEENITPEAVKDCNLKYYPVGTVCVAMYGGAGTIGKSGILGMVSTINQSVCGMYPNKYFLPEFLHCYVKSIRSEWMKFAAGLRKDPNINGKIIDRMVVPIPPLNEQKRIVEKVEQLMGLCDELESKSKKEREDSEKLMEAVVRGLLEGAAAEI
ncbi:restriction endonuclease subunit S [Methanosarcina sp. KYL-1]|uniref:restriction endonuclease subunit S n=1 Tax=Methanosarcina sp. KYL-1 TaxID=2602068 RepID=UPI0021007A24|nr:restriction endonuclease subunit S [Methanosarcina sp. KYL-1]MCQ1536421.1 restriction endonuclease subunit S [Methanosarcina sp. KYL-1]